MSFRDSIAIEKLGGLTPRAWVAVGAGFSREDIKDAVFEKGLALTAQAVTTLPGIAAEILERSNPFFSKQRVLRPAARQEFLRSLLTNRALSKHFPGLIELRRQRGFYRKLDRAIQSGREAIAHFEEDEVLSQRLKPRAIRDEVRQLGRMWETALGANQLWDEPLALRQAIEALREHGWPFAPLEKIYFLTAQTSESLEREFCEELSRAVPVERVGPSDGVPVESAKNWAWQRWHTLDDAVEDLADRLAAEASLEHDVVLIPDYGNIRRSLNRALAARGIPQSDPRDPQRLKWDESLKWALLPLEVVTSDYDREKVIAWIQTWEEPSATAAKWIAEILSRGIRKGIHAYEGGALVLLHQKLETLSSSLGGSGHRKTLSEIAEAHLKILETGVATRPDSRWVLDFFEATWEQFRREATWLGDEDSRRTRAHSWFERLEARVAEAPAPPELLRARNGLAVYRVHQAPWKPARRVWILGVPPSWLSGSDGAPGDYWFSEKERETLSGEFGVRSGMEVRRERLSALRSWIGAAEEIYFLDAEYESDGRERPSLAPFLRELGREIGAVLPEDHQDLGAHQRWLASYGAMRPIPVRQLALPALRPRVDGGPIEISATALDHYSRCGFQALAYDRWKLRDLREPDTELWSEVRGNILHQAVKNLLLSRDDEGRVRMSTEEALERAWTEKPPRGLMKSPRVESYVRSRLRNILDAFLVKEREFQERACSKTIALDDRGFRLDYPAEGFSIIGTPDRVEQNSLGVFIIDYKSSGALPNGTEMLELGYRLQLPFYALAARKELGESICGVQFIELNRKASRSNGVFFSRYNGKESGKFTSVRSNSKSLLAVEPDEAWSRMQDEIESQARAYISGKFEAAPKRQDKECASCSLGEFCGLKRVTQVEGEAVE